MKVYTISYWDQDDKHFRLRGGLEVEIYSTEKIAQDRCDELNKLFPNSEVESHVVHTVEVDKYSIK